jgi:hypothetical protein
MLRYQDSLSMKLCVNSGSCRYFMNMGRQELVSARRVLFCCMVWYFLTSRQDHLHQSTANISKQIQKKFTGHFDYWMSHFLPTLSKGSLRHSYNELVMTLRQRNCGDRVPDLQSKEMHIQYILEYQE